MNTHKPLALVAFALALAGTVAGTALGQPAVSAPLVVPAGDPPLSSNDLRTLVGPIALYPDDLVGIILPASTYPLQVVQAARFLERTATESGLSPDPDWDNAVVALLNYPEVLRLMDENLDWTWALGESVLSQQSDVIDAIQGFREDAYLAGNLRSDERQFVTENEGAIEIRPADPQVIYIPYYEPERVVVRQPRPAYFYYTNPYPLYYYPYPIGYSFSTGFFWGVTSAFAIGWHTHYVSVYDYGYLGHPYYNRPYYAPYYARHGVNVNVNVNVNNHTHAWQPTDHHASRPQHRNERDRVVYSREHYTDSLQRSSQSRRQASPITLSPTRSETRGQPAETTRSRSVQGRIGTTPTQESALRSTRAVPGNTRTVDRDVDRDAGSSRGVDSRRTIGSIAPREQPGGSGNARQPAATPSARIANPRMPAAQRSAPSAAPQTRAPQPDYRSNGRIDAGNTTVGRSARTTAREGNSARATAAPRERASSPRGNAPNQAAARTPTFAPSSRGQAAAPQPRGDGGNRSARTRAQR